MIVVYSWNWDAAGRRRCGGRFSGAQCHQCRYINAIFPGNISPSARRRIAIGLVKSLLLLLCCTLKRIYLWLSLGLRETCVPSAQLSYKQIRLFVSGETIYERMRITEIVTSQICSSAHFSLGFVASVFNSSSCPSCCSFIRSRSVDETFLPSTVPPSLSPSLNCASNRSA